jgi:hypothetical protein
MNAQDLIVAITSLFIMGMIWLRTRTHYVHGGGGPSQLAPAGRVYFGAAAAVLIVGWFAAPLIGEAFWPNTGVTPMLTRVVWCLATYYVFIIVHRVVKSRGARIFIRQE